MIGDFTASRPRSSENNLRSFEPRVEEFSFSLSKRIILAAFEASLSSSLPKTVVNVVIVKAKSKVRKETWGKENETAGGFTGTRTCCSRIRITSRRNLQVLSRRRTGVRRVRQGLLHEPGQIGQLSFHVLHSYPATDNSRSRTVNAYPSL